MFHIDCLEEYGSCSEDSIKLQSYPILPKKILVKIT
jgi:hypothetical protein